MTKDSLLTQSIVDFSKKEQNVTIYKTKRITNNQGFMFILLTEPSVITASIHYREHYDLREEFGKVQTVRALLNTRTPIDPYSVIYYDSLYFFIDRQDDYNATMGQWHYELLASFGYLNNNFILLDESQMLQNPITTTSYPFIYQYLNNFHSNTPLNIYPLNFKIVFSKLQNTNTLIQGYKYILLETSGTYPQSIINNLEPNKVTLNNYENVTLHCINHNQEEVLNLAYYITQTSYYDNIGLTSIPKVKQVDDYIKELGIKPLAHSIKFSINYKLQCDILSQYGIIKEVTFNMLKNT